MVIMPPPKTNAPKANKRKSIPRNLRDDEMNAKGSRNLKIGLKGNADIVD